MFKNKITIFIITVILAVSAIGQTALAFPAILDDVPMKEMLTSETTAGDFSNANVKRAFRLLNYLNIISADEKDFIEDEVVSRAYAVSAFGAMLSGRNVSGEAESFSDVPSTHLYAAGISQALQYGILNEEMGKFYPNKNVSYEDISEWALKVLKYDTVWTNMNPMVAADELGFFKGINGDSDYVTYGQFMRILENILNSKIVDVWLGANGIEYSVSETKTFLSEKYNIYVQNGILTGYKYSSLYGDISLKSDKVQINRAEYNISEELSVDYVGYNVCAYVCGDDRDTIITLWLDEKKNSIYEIQRENYVSFDLSRISYENTKRISLDNNIRMMRNDLFDGYYNSAVLNSLYATDKIIVVDNDGDEIGDLIKIYQYTHYFVKSVSTLSESIVFGNEGGTLDVGVNSTTEFVFEGNKINPLTDLKANDVLTALEGVKANGDRVFSAEISRDVAEGKISRTGSDDEGPYYIIDDECYYLSAELQAYLARNASKNSSGAYIQAYIGTDKKIVFIKSGNDFMYGYVMNAIYDPDTEEAIMTVYTDEGSVKKFYFDEKVRVQNSVNKDGIKMKKSDARDEFYSNGVIRNELIAYTLNSEGLVNRIAFAIDRTAYKPNTLSYPLTLDLNYTPTGDADSKARLYRGILGSKYVMNGTTPLFIVPSPETGLTKDEKLYQMTTGGKWSLEKYFGPSEVIKAYNCDKFYKPQFYVINGEVVSNISQGDGKVHFYVIDRVGEVFNEEEGYAETQISYYDNTTYKTVAAADDIAISKAGVYSDVTDINQLKRGDIIQLHMNALGKIDILTVYFRISEHSSKALGMYYYEDSNDSTATYTTDASSAMPNIGIVYGRVKDSEGNRVIIETVSNVESPVSVAGSVYGNAYFTVYDTKRNTSQPTNFAEMQPGDLVVMRKYYNHVQDVVIIR